MGGSPVSVWRVGRRGRACSASDELDTIVRLGDGLALEKAELSVGGAGYDSIRATQVAWVPRNPKTESLLPAPGRGRAGAQCPLLPLRPVGAGRSSSTRSMAAPEGGHFDWHKDYGRDPSDPGQRAAQADLVACSSATPSDYEGCELAGARRPSDRCRAQDARHPDRLPRQCAAPGDADHAGHPPFAGDMGGGAGIPLRRGRT